MLLWPTDIRLLAEVSHPFTSSPVLVYISQTVKINDHVRTTTDLPGVL